MKAQTHSAIPLRPPLSDEDVEQLNIGDKVSISGVLYTARDAAHKRLLELIDHGKALPLDLKGQIIYYVGPTPSRPGRVIGSAGPTTAVRMDPYTPKLLSRGLKATLGKGYRSQEVIDALVKHKAIYLMAIGGAGALLSKHIRKADIVAYEDLGTEAIFRLEVEDFPAIVANDTKGRDVFKEGQKRYALL